MINSTELLAYTKKLDVLFVEDCDGVGYKMTPYADG